MNTNLNKKLQNYALLAVTGSLLLNTGCKKDDDEKVTDNPNVEFIDIEDIVVDATSKLEEVKKLDINGDGVDDVAIYAYNYSADGYIYKYTSVDGLSSGGGIATRKVTSTIDADDYYFIATDVQSGKSIKDQSFLNVYGYTSVINVVDSKKFEDGLQGKGDKYIGVKFKIGSADHYGWLKVNVDANAVKITVKEAAYNKVPDESLNAGDR